MHKEPQIRISTFCEGKGEGVLSSAPTRIDTPLRQDPLSPAPSKVSSPGRARARSRPSGWEAAASSRQQQQLSG